jgi:hypothetical protein
LDLFIEICYAGFVEYNSIVLSPAAAFILTFEPFEFSQFLCITIALDVHCLPDCFAAKGLTTHFPQQMFEAALEK